MPNDKQKSPSDLNVEKPQVISPRQARGGFLSGQVLLVLLTSLALAGVAMFVLLNIQWK